MREVAVGDKLDQYEITKLIARSGMASIFEAKDTASGTAVALKVPHLQFESDVVFFERFQREEEIGQRLDHPNIIKFLKPRHKSRMYVAMELVEGKSLRKLMEEEHPLPTTRALAIAQQGCEALEHMHKHGVVHRDLKPENVLITSTGLVQIIGKADHLVRSLGHHRHAGLHRAGADRRSTRRRAHRHLRPRHHPLRDAHRQPAVLRSQRVGRDARQD